MSGVILLSVDRIVATEESLENGLPVCICKIVSIGVLLFPQIVIG